MKRFICLALVCAAIFYRGAYRHGTTKTRAGDTSGRLGEIGNEVFMNIIAAGDIRKQHQL